MIGHRNLVDDVVRPNKVTSPGINGGNKCIFFQTFLFGSIVLDNTVPSISVRTIIISQRADCLLAFETETVLNRVCIFSSEQSMKYYQSYVPKLMSRKVP